MLELHQENVKCPVVGEFTFVFLWKDPNAILEMNLLLERVGVVADDFSLYRPRLEIGFELARKCFDKNIAEHFRNLNYKPLCDRDLSMKNLAWSLDQFTNRLQKIKSETSGLAHVADLIVISKDVAYVRRAAEKLNLYVSQPETRASFEEYLACVEEMCLLKPV